MPIYNLSVKVALRELRIFKLESSIASIDETIGYLHVSPNLECLEFNDCVLYDVAELQHCKNLQSLAITHANSALQNIFTLTQLKHLHIEAGFFLTICIAHKENWYPLATNLQYLELGHVTVSRSRLRSIYDMLNILTCLKKVSFHQPVGNTISHQTNENKRLILQSLFSDFPIEFYFDAQLPECDLFNKKRMLCKYIGNFTNRYEDSEEEDEADDADEGDEGW